MTDHERAVMQQALDVLNLVSDEGESKFPATIQGAISDLEAALAEPVQEPVLQALADADRIMGHDDESTEWRERWAHLFSCALTNGGYQCSCGASQKVHRPAPPQRPAEPVQEPDSPERRCGGPGCDLKCCQPVEENKDA